jgi:diguanylate cyclase (GGDEF)-like protein
MDVDSFKAINDRAGHAEGDRALQGVAQALREGLRTSDRSFRWGGDEFAVLLPSTDHPGALTLRDRVEARLAEVSGDRFEHPLELSWGIAALIAADDDRSFLGHADLDLMAEKARKQAERAAPLPSA